jgi:hypothetical protein
MEQRIAVPAYFDDAKRDDPVWERLAAAQGVVALAVFDDWTTLTRVKPRLKVSGIKAFGLVATHKATVELDVCQAEIDDWFRIHPDLDGIFLEEGPPLDTQHPATLEPAWVWDYYGDNHGQGLYHYIKRKKPGAKVFLDCAGCKDAGVFSVCDIAQVVDVDYARYKDKLWWLAASQSWWTSPPTPKTIAHLVHSCPAEEHDWSLRVAVALSKARQAELVYVFDGEQATYHTLPAFWQSEVVTVAANPADPCRLIGNVLSEMSAAVDDLAAAIDDTTGPEKARLIDDLARLGEQRAEIEVVLDDCHEEWRRSRNRPA